MLKSAESINFWNARVLKNERFCEAKAFVKGKRYVIIVFD